MILGAEGVFANGGIKARCGSHLVALAAKQHSVPLYVLAATHQFSNEHYCDTTGKEIQFNRWCDLLINISSCNQQSFSFNSIMSPEQVLSYKFAKKEDLKDVEVFNPEFDYVPPGLVTLLISNAGGMTPLNLYHLLGEQYHIGDDFNTWFFSSSNCIFAVLGCARNYLFGDFVSFISGLFLFVCLVLVRMKFFKEIKVVLFENQSMSNIKNSRKWLMRWN